MHISKVWRDAENIRLVFVSSSMWINKHTNILLCQILSVKLDEWTDEQVDALIKLGGNASANRKFEAHVPDIIKKPRPESSIEERSDYIK